MNTIAPNRFFKFLMILIYPVGIFGYVCTPIAIVWLIVLGDWKILALGLVIATVVSFLLPFLLLPPGLILSELAKSTKLTNFSINSASLFGVFYVTLISWVLPLQIMKLFISKISEENTIPVLILSYGVALVPFMRLTKTATEIEEGKSEMFNTFFIQLSFITAIVSYYFGAGLKTVTLIFSVLLILLSIIYLVSTWNDGDNKLNSQDVDEDENLKQKKQWTKEERMKVVKALYNATHPKREDQRQKDLERSLNNKNKQEP